MDEPGGPPLSHDPPCPICRHAWHLLVCDDEGCRCENPPIPGITL